MDVVGVVQHQQHQQQQQQWEQRVGGAVAGAAGVVAALVPVVGVAEAAALGGAAGKEAVGALTVALKRFAQARGGVSEGADFVAAAAVVAAAVVEALLAAGYQPTVYRNTAPPAFLFRGGQVLEVFDPFDWHNPPLSPW